MPKPFPFRLATFITFEEFSGERPTLEELRNWLKKFSRPAVVNAACVINAMLETWTGNINVNSHNALVNDAFSPDDAYKLLKICTSSEPSRLVFNRLQVLLVAKEAILHCPEDGINPFQKKHWGGLGLAFLMANDLTYREFPSPQSSAEKVLQVLMQFIPVSEYSSPSSLHYGVARANKILAECVGQSVDLHKEFKQITGVDTGTFLTLLIAVMSHYIGLDYEQLKNGKVGLTLQRSFFDRATIDRKMIDIFLNEVAAKLDTIKNFYETRNSGLMDMTAIRNWPLCWQAEDAFCAMDTRFLLEKLQSGIFWKVHNSLTNSKQRDGLHQLWGRAFEQYVNRMLKESASPALNAFFPAPKANRTGEELCDAIIICGHEAILLEYKGHTFRAESKYGSDTNSLQTEIEEHLVGNESKPKGVRQLANAIIKIFDPNSPIEIDGLDLSGVNTVYPVLVTRDDIGGSLLMSRYLNSKFQSILFKRKYRPLTITPIFCLSSEGLETIAAYFADAKMSKILEAWYRKDPVLNFAFLAVPNIVTGSIGDRRNSTLESAFDELMDAAKAMLFPEDN